MLTNEADFGTDYFTRTAVAPPVRDRWHPASRPEPAGKHADRLSRGQSLPPVADASKLRCIFSTIWSMLKLAGR